MFGLSCGSAVKNPSAMQETRVRSLGQEDPLDKETATHCSMIDGLGNPMDRGSWWATVHGIAEESDTS